jgi:hypothetical protein
MFSNNKLRVALMAFLLLSCSQALWSADPVTSFSDREYEFHSVVPLGTDALQLRPAKRVVNLLATAESHGFEGIRRVPDGDSMAVVGRDGRAVRYYPSQVSFRLTATGRGHLQGIDAAPIDTQAELNDYILGLHFRLKVFRGVNFSFIEPQSVDMLGMPANINYDERIYHISFSLDHVPAEDRIVLEVLDSSGERVSRFHLELM